MVIIERTISLHILRRLSKNAQIPKYGVVFVVEKIPSVLQQHIDFLEVCLECLLVLVVVEVGGGNAPANSGFGEF